MANASAASGPAAKAIADKKPSRALAASAGVLMTIIVRVPSRSRASVNQKDLQWVKTGLAGTVTPTVAPDARAAASVTQWRASRASMETSPRSSA